MRYLAFILLSILSVLACTDPEEMSVIEYDTVSDIQGNIYKTVKIGSQWWMAENLEVTQFRNGDAILNFSAPDQWTTTDLPSYCNYNNQNQNTGLLYNYKVVEDNRNIAPEGWHVPTDEEWKQLESYIGMPLEDVDDVNWRGSLEGDMLKKDSLTEWSKYDNVWPTNDYGFSAQSGSCRFFEGEFGIPGLKRSGFWWTSTKLDSNAWFRYMDYKKSGIFRYYAQPNYGFSIRCVKD